MKILVVEDEEKLARFIKRGLEQESFAVDVVADGKQAVNQILFGSYDCVVLDIMLPGKNGIEVCEYVRDKNNTSPILMLTARSGLEDKISALNVGADDYLVKPFEFEELKARIRALMRRSSTVAPLESFTVDDVTLDCNAHKVFKQGKELSMSLKEFAVFEYLIRNRGRVVSREQILEHCWGYDFDSFSNIVDVYVKRVRDKLDSKNHDTYIKTVRGMGYTIT